MSLQGQGWRSRVGGEGGYAMAALLVALAVMAVLMSVALPVWRHEAQREKEAELVFRANQYTRAIGLFQRKTQSFPTSVDMLVEGRFLRKKYKDPITNDDFDYIPAAGVAGPPGQGGRGGSQQGGAVGSGIIPGGLLGVRSKSKAETIMLLNGSNHYNEWRFTPMAQQPGGSGGRGQGGGATGGRGGRGQTGGGPGGRGGPGT